MALPKVDFPTYNTTIPSTGALIKFRPFNVREEKILLTALEAEDMEDVANSLKEVISACTFRNADPDKLTTYDIEFLFLQIRMRSVAPEVTINFRNRQCPKNDNKPCDKTVGVEIDLEEVTVQRYNKDTETFEDLDGSGYDTRMGDKVPLSDTQGVTMRHPGIDTAKRIQALESELEQIEQTIFSCITSIYDEETVYDQFSRDELVEWYEELPRTSKEAMVDYVQRLPRLRKTAEFYCPRCEYKEELVFEGLQSFFS